MSVSRDKVPESIGDPTKDAEFGRVVDHFLNTRVKPKEKPKAKRSNAKKQKEPSVSKS